MHRIEGHISGGDISSDGPSDASGRRPYNAMHGVGAPYVPWVLEKNEKCCGLIIIIIIIMLGASNLQHNTG